MQEAIEAWVAKDEFAGIFVTSGVPRAPMSRPPRVQASRLFASEVQQVIEEATSTEQIADWIADKMERFGALMAEPMFDTHGNGPICSWCKTIWPLCGHHHVSQRVHEIGDAL